jgi:hypothetical protein
MSDAIVLAAIDGLNASGVDYMLTGGLAGAMHGLTRSTKDADFVIELPTGSVAAIVQRFGPGFSLEQQVYFETITGTTRHVIRHADDPFIVEMFLLSDDPHDRERFARRQPVEVAGRRTFVVRPEDYIISKLRWFKRGRRTKDGEDIRHVMTVQRDSLDWSYVEQWCGQHGTTELLHEYRAKLPPR